MYDYYNQGPTDAALKERVAGGGGGRGAMGRGRERERERDSLELNPKEL